MAGMNQSGSTFSKLASRLTALSAAALLSVAAVGCFVGGWFGGGLPQIAYVSSPGGAAGVWVHDPAAADSVRMSGRNAIAGHPRWSPGQAFLAWVSAEADDIRLMLYDALAGDTTMLVGDLDPEQPPVWSPDGAHIAYVSDADGDYDIYMIDLETRTPTRLTFSAERERIGDWSPDGRWLVFTESGRDGLLLRNPDGVNRISLTDGADSAAVWSPKGDRIAFLRDTGDGRDVYVLRPTDSGDWTRDTEELAVSGMLGDEFSPSWSADGRRIAFVHRGAEPSEIYSVLVDGKDQKQLTHNRVDDLSPVWASTGDMIVFVSYAYGNAEILYMNGDGADQLRITANDHPDTSPDW